MPRIAIFTDDPGWHGAGLRRAFAARGYSGEYVSLTECRMSVEPGRLPVSIPGFDHVLPDAAFVRGVPGGSLEEVVFYLDILHALKELNVAVYNDGRAIERSVDKGMTSFLLQNAGVPTPPTWIVRNRAEALSIAESELRSGHRVVSKPLFGSQGSGLRLFKKMSDLFWLAGSRGIYYLQRFVPCEGSGFSDWRIFVINGEVVAAMKRRGVSWLNNVARGAKCEAVEPENNMEELAVKAVTALKMDYAGVDIIRDREGRDIVIEVNSIPAWKGLQGVCRLDIAELLARDLIDRRIGRTVILPQAVS
ncbi:MAG: ATP-grasp domain-containing protein [Gammaproteobacteria bacterium]